MTINDSSTLSALITAYRKAVVFRESVPSAFRVAKVLSEMRWSNGGLVLLGVQEDGAIVGVDPEELDGIYERFQGLGDLTVARVEIGTLAIADRVVVFLVFNPIPRNTEPLERYSRSIGRVRFF